METFQVFLTLVMNASKDRDIMKKNMEKKHKRYWVHLAEEDRVRVFLANSPVQKSEGVLCTISDCKEWEDFQIFYDNEWTDATLQAPENAHVFDIVVQVTRISTETADDAKKAVQSQYGSKASVTHVSSKCLQDD